jgi:hypothetical protein
MGDVALDKCRNEEVSVIISVVKTNCCRDILIRLNGSGKVSWFKLVLEKLISVSLVSQVLVKKSKS